jgi:hypothetical protein
VRGLRHAVPHFDQKAHGYDHRGQPGSAAEQPGDDALAPSVLAPQGRSRRVSR